MCTFVLGTFPANAPLERMETRGRREYFRFTRLPPGTVASVLYPGEWFGRLTSRYCDCETALGRRTDTKDAGQGHQETLERKADRLRRKGWSRNRIERWATQVESDKSRHAKAEAENRANEAREWHRWLRHALEDVGVEYVGILVDDFRGRLDEAYDDGEKAAPSTRDVRVRDVDEQFLESLKRGVLYRVRR